MQKLKIIITFLLVLAGVQAAGQEQASISLAYPVYSQYLHNGLVINPAYAGSREAISVFLSYRDQWLGIDGAPTSQTLSLHSLMKNDHVGLGLTGQYYTYGVSKLVSANANYAYQVRLGNGRLALGLNAGFNMLSSNYSADFINSLTSSRVTGSPSDPAFAADEKPITVPNIGSGFYYFSEKFFIGAAVPSFISFTSNSGQVTYKTFKDFDILLSAGGLITFTDAFKLKPSVFVQSSTQKTKPMRIDLNVNFIISDFLWLGGSWRTSEQVVVGILQLQVNPQLMFGLSYDYAVGKIDLNSNGSLEAIFRYEFGYRVSAANPKYF